MRIGVDIGGTNLAGAILAVVHGLLAVASFLAEHGL